MFRLARWRRVVLVVIVDADVRDVLVAENADEPACQRRLAGRGVADDTKEDRAPHPVRPAHIAPRTATVMSSDFLVVFCKHAALHDVVGGDRHQLFPGDVAHAVCEQTIRLAQPGAIDRVADAAPVCETWALDPPLEVGPEGVLGTRAEHVVLVLEHQVRDRHQLVDVVVGEIDVVSDPRAQTRVRAEEVVHPVLVAGEDHDEVVALGLHHLEQDLDRLGAVVALVLRLVQVVRPHR